MQKHNKMAVLQDRRHKACRQFLLYFCNTTLFSADDVAVEEDVFRNMCVILFKVICGERSNIPEAHIPTTHTSSLTHLNLLRPYFENINSY
jgi:hypothetical protein